MCWERNVLQNFFWCNSSAQSGTLNKTKLINYMFLSSTRLFLVAANYLVEGYADNIRLSAPDIASRYNMNSRALMPALRRLTQVGILKSQTGGNSPGFIFARDPETISIYEIILAIEGETKFSCCREHVEGVTCEVVSKDDCMIYKIINEGILHTINQLKKAKISDNYELDRFSRQKSDRTVLI